VTLPLGLALGLVLAPALQGLIKTAKGRLQSRWGPPPLQPYADLWKLARKGTVEPEPASWVFRAAPWVVLASTVGAAALVPTIAVDGVGPGDAVLFAGLLALGRVALALAALDTGSNFAHMGASREVALGALVEPALLAGVFALAIPVGTTALGEMAARRAEVGLEAAGPAALLALAALLVVAIAETGRVPIDNPDTHLELTMIHEGMLLEYSGRSLGVLVYATHLKQLAVLGLIAALFLPWTLVGAGATAGLAVGAYVAKLAGLGLLLAAVETVNAKLRILRLPDLLATAAALGGLSLVARAVFGG
jgi:formate hydrogenlyase subunit 4